MNVAISMVTGNTVFCTTDGSDVFTNNVLAATAAKHTATANIPATASMELNCVAQSDGGGLSTQATQDAAIPMASVLVTVAADTTVLCTNDGTVVLTATKQVAGSAVAYTASTAIAVTQLVQLSCVAKSTAGMFSAPVTVWYKDHPKPNPPVATPAGGPDQFTPFAATSVLITVSDGSTVFCTMDNTPIVLGTTIAATAVAYKESTYIVIPKLTQLLCVTESAAGGVSNVAGWWYKLPTAPAAPAVTPAGGAAQATAAQAYSVTVAVEAGTTVWCTTDGNAVLMGPAPTLSATALTLKVTTAIQVPNLMLVNCVAKGLAGNYGSQVTMWYMPPVPPALPALTPLGGATEATAAGTLAVTVNVVAGTKVYCTTGATAVLTGNVLAATAVEYTAPIPIAASTVLNCAAKSDAGAFSAAVSKWFKKPPPPAAPVVTPVGGTDAKTTVAAATVSVAVVDGTSVYCTTDGTAVLTSKEGLFGTAVTPAGGADKASAVAAGTVSVHVIDGTTVWCTTTVPGQVAVAADGSVIAPDETEFDATTDVPIDQLMELTCRAQSTEGAYTATVAPSGGAGTDTAVEAVSVTIGVVDGTVVYCTTDGSTDFINTPTVTSTATAADATDSMKDAGISDSAIAHTEAGDMDINGDTQLNCVAQSAVGAIGMPVTVFYKLPPAPAPPALTPAGGDKEATASQTLMAVVPVATGTTVSCTFDGTMAAVGNTIAAAATTYSLTTSVAVTKSVPFTCVAKSAEGMVSTPVVTRWFAPPPPLAAPIARVSIGVAADTKIFCTADGTAVVTGTAVAQGAAVYAAATDVDIKQLTQLNCVAVSTKYTGLYSAPGKQLFRSRNRLVS
ncbi:hypothetical protein JKP88DRAFT_282908 [Tribonema minus]|uniref:Uncharacterized protein n=1 Tax=Tribonema minus TaxID=303371 RepID=A0A836C7T4_9STRA|nr:hypothetical protein JKP88DRAFT_282908 [Tribonema minus]